MNVIVTNPLGASAPTPVTLLLASSRFIFTSPTVPTAGGSVTIYLASPVPGHIAVLGYSGCLGPFAIPPFVTFFIGVCGDLQLAGVPVLDGAGISSLTVSIPATLHGTVFLQYAETDPLLATIPFLTSTFFQLSIP